MRVVDDRHYVEKRAELREAQINELMSGGLRSAQRACREEPAERKEACIDARVAEQTAAAEQRMHDSFAQLEQASKTCAGLREAELAACAERMLPQAPAAQDDRWSVESAWARETLDCAHAGPALSASCRALEAFGTQPLAEPAAAERWLGAAVVASYRGHVHHELVAAALQERSGDRAKLCLFFVTCDDEREQAQVEAAIRALLLGQPARDNPAYQWARSHPFAPEDCLPARRAHDGRWSSDDEDWQLAQAGAHIAVRARDWGQQHSLLLAELDPPAPAP
ncbi:MAG TPA: hypothetical protein VK509_13510 [Polyangiales bacterium]|nr:hypothetical protein [Polyangiales bacterium]